MSETDFVGPTTKSLQATPSSTSGGFGEISNRLKTFLLSVTASISSAPSYGMPTRDDWLVDFVKSEGNDLLAGAVSTVAAKIASTSWYLEGPLQLVELCRNMLLLWSDFGQGWDHLVLKWVQSYLNRDMGGTTELLRSSAADRTGPALGYAHLDESKCSLSGDPEFPLLYYHPTKGPIKVHRTQVARIVDLPNPDTTYKGMGFCAVSRALVTAEVLMDVTKYKRERLSDLPPAGLLLLNNLSPEQWEDLEKKYDARQHNEGNSTWRDVMVACGVDPAYPTTAELIEFAKLPEHFDDKVATEVAIYSFALAFREDPREFWPVSSGPLGTATEAEIQARKARSKGEGIIYVAIERQINRPECLPEGVTFHFDFQDDEEDKLKAEINDRKTMWIRRLWEASPNRLVGAGGPMGTEDEGSEEQQEQGAEQQEQPPRQRAFPQQGQQNPQDRQLQFGGSGIITTEQAQQLLVLEGVVPAQILGLQAKQGRLYDTRARDFRRDAYGTNVRMYRDGTLRPLLGGV